MCPPRWMCSPYHGVPSSRWSSLLFHTGRVPPERVSLTDLCLFQKRVFLFACFNLSAHPVGSVRFRAIGGGEQEWTCLPSRSTWGPTSSIASLSPACTLPAVSASLNRSAFPMNVPLVAHPVGHDTLFVHPLAASPEHAGILCVMTHFLHTCWPPRW
jgi:hypothetical protein